MHCSREFLISVKKQQSNQFILDSDQSNQPGFNVDSQTIKNHILDKLNNDPEVDASKIGVIVDQGVVTLTGRVHSMETCARAEKLASEVLGVKAIAQEIQHEYSHSEQPDDEEIAAKILSEFKRDTMVPEDQLQVHVQDGRVVVKGDVYWLYQKNAVTVVLDSINNIKDKVNQIEVIQPESDHDLEAHIAAKLARLDNINPDGIDIKCKSGAVTLTGHIEANVERATVIHAVKSIAGVRYVSDHLSPAS